MGGKTYQLIGLAPEKHREALRNAALTSAALDRRGARRGHRQAIADRGGARRENGLENLGARSGNVWSPAYTALVNGLNVEADLREGQPVKIAREESWTK